MIGGTTRAMRERQRVEIVRNLLAARGFLSIADLMAATGVSAASARRDAGRLAEAGYGERVYGGIQALGGAFSRRMAQASLETQAFDVSRTINIEAKRAIARRALEMCVVKDVIIINGVNFVGVYRANKNPGNKIDPNGQFMNIVWVNVGPKPGTGPRGMTFAQKKTKLFDDLADIFEKNIHDSCAFYAAANEYLADSDLVETVGRPKRKAFDIYTWP